MNPLDFHSVSIVKHKHHLEVFEVVKVSKKEFKIMFNHEPRFHGTF